MNERIQQLAKQAGDYVNETYTGPVRSKTPGKIWEDGHVGWHTQFNQKFALLIVRECMTQIEEVKQIQVRQMPVLEYTQGFDDGMFVAIRTIEEHFGVEL